MQPQQDTAIKKGLEYLAAAQNKDGGFIGYLSTNPHKYTNKKSVLTTFTPSLMLSALSAIDHPQAVSVREKIANFLLAERSSYWSFNYWSKEEMSKHDFVYPDDLDDTFAALTGLCLHDPRLITPEALAAMTKLLIKTESEVGGPYRTWLVPPGSEREWLDVDVVVNSNIAYFLSLFSSVPPNVNRLITESIKNEMLHSPYYPSLYQVSYFMSRNQIGTASTQRLIELLGTVTVNNPSPMEQALLATTLMRLDIPRDQCMPHITALTDSQHSDGSWAAGALYVNHHTKKDTYYIGSNAITTAFALEALALYKNYRTEKLAHTPKPVTDVPNSVFSLAQKKISSLPDPLHGTLLQVISDVYASKNSTEITRFAYKFNQSLKNPLSRQDTFLDKLGAANLYGWSAYTIYDNFLDAEGNPLLLSAANTSLRLSYELFLQAYPKQTFQTYIRETFAAIDNANTWELAYSQFNTYKKRTITIGPLPDYGNLWPLAERSIGHTIAPLAVLAKSGIEPNSPEFQAVYIALRHYLIAKQLDDDAHDWQEDFLHGRVTYVVAVLLSEMAVPQGTYTFNTLLPAMQKHFWHNTLATICLEMKRQVQVSRTSLESAQQLNSSNVITAMLDTIDGSIKTTLSKQAQTKEFLKHF